MKKMLLLLTITIAATMNAAEREALKREYTPEDIDWRHICKASTILHRLIKEYRERNEHAYENYDLTTDIVTLMNSTTDQSGNFLLLDAARSGHIRLVRLLLECGEDVNRKNPTGDTALHSAAAQGHETVVRLLIDHGAHIAAKDDQGNTTLHSATIGGRTTIVELLLDNNADLTAKNDHGAVALHHAARYGQDNIAAVLVAHGADINSRDSLGNTPLHDAVRCGFSATTERLLALGADVHMPNNAGVTPLQVGSQIENVKLHRILTAHAAKIAQAAAASTL